MTWESTKRRAARRRRDKLRGQTHKMRRPGNVATHLAQHRWRESEKDKAAAAWKSYRAKESEREEMEWALRRHSIF